MSDIFLICDNCTSEYHVSYETWRGSRSEKKCNNINHYCSVKCRLESRGYHFQKEVSCLNCQTTFTKHHNAIKRSPNHFCSRSCSAIYNNKNKTHGNRKSKLEIWLESNLAILYPDLEIHYNRKDAINSELDIYIPSLRLAFELNGIFHYEPIFGKEKLDQIQNNDQRKFQACFEKGIEFCIIDTSSQKYVKDSTSQVFLDIIIKIINQKLS